MLNSNTGPNNIVPKQKIRKDLVDYSTKPVQRKMGLVVLTKKRTKRRVRLIVLKQIISRDLVGYLTKPAQKRMRLVVLNRKITEPDLAGYLTNLIQKRIRTVALKQKICSNKINIKLKTLFGFLRFSLMNLRCSLMDSTLIRKRWSWKPKKSYSKENLTKLERIHQIVVFSWTDSHMARRRISRQQKKTFSDKVGTIFFTFDTYFWSVRSQEKLTSKENLRKLKRVS